MDKNLGIFFDLDGTLLDSAESIYESFCVAFKQHHHKPPSKAHTISLIGATLDDMFRHSGVPDEMLKSYIEAYKQHYRSIALDKTTLLPQASEAVQRAYEQAYLAVVTTKIHASSERILHQLGLLPYFGCIIGRDDTTHPKPHAEPILNAIAQSAQKLQKVFMIGDTAYDLLSAKNAAMCASIEVIGIGVLSGSGTKQELEALSPYVVEDALQAILLVETLQNHKN